MNYRISLISPCFNRPLRTRRLINNILNQNINGWEAFVIGDGCPHFENLFLTGEADTYIKIAQEKGNRLVLINEPHTGYHGYQIYQKYKTLCNSPYVVFAGNDDVLLPHHFQHYLSEIENTEYDLVYYKTFIALDHTIRDPELSRSKVGHSELIIKKESILGYTHKTHYDDDWGLIDYLLSAGCKHKKATSQDYSYCVSAITNKTNDIID
jgi:hypothetical protein